MTLRHRALLPLVLSLLLGAGAACTVPPAEESESETGGGGWAEVGKLKWDEYAATPIPEERIERAIEQVDGVAEDVMRRSGVPGIAIGVVHDGKIVHTKGFGVRKKGETAPVEPETVFQIASVSKSIGSTCVAREVSDGVVSWTDPVTKYLPDFALSDPAATKMVTIADLYSHRSGIPGAAGDDLEGIGYDRDYILSRLRQFPLNPFRISYGYTNFGMTTGAEAVAAAAKTPWEQLCKEKLYEPLGMTSTSSSYADFLARENRTTLHARVGATDFEPKYVRDPDPQSPAGGVSSTVEDLGRWMIMNLEGGRHEGEQLIKPEVLQEAHTGHIAASPAEVADARSRYYGYGFNVETTSTGHVRWTHSGAFAVGAGTAYAMLPQADVGIVVLSNAAPVGAVEAIAASFTDLVRTGRIERDWLDYIGNLYAPLYLNPSKVAEPAPADAAAPRDLDAYVGSYRNDYAGDVEVTRSGDTLTVEIGPKAKRLKATLTPYDGDTFSWLSPGGNGEPVSAVTFSQVTGGKAQQVQLEFLQINDFRRT